MAEIKTCPFCGEPARIDYMRKYNQYVILCYHKPICYLFGRMPPKYNIKEILIADWNRRSCEK